jgi:hypothetical protein
LHRTHAGVEFLWENAISDALSSLQEPDFDATFWPAYFNWAWRFSDNTRSGVAELNGAIEKRIMQVFLVEQRDRRRPCQGS